MSNKTSRLPGQAAPGTVIGGRSPAIRKWLRGNPLDPSWQRPALLALLALTSLLYVWGLDRNGWANSYYSAAAMAGSEDWTAFFYGSSDPGNAITVDKPPMSLWIMSLSVRIFGLNPWSILLPQALMGVLSVYLLYRMVQKRTDPATGLLAGLFFAVTPVATVMFRYNNPDALLTLLMIGAAYATLEAIDQGKLRWLLAAGACVGAGFLTKQLQVALILPAIALAYLVFARVSVLSRLLHLGAALLAAAAASGWWFMIAQLGDPARRPFIGGSRSNSIWELTLGYNGLDRLTGTDASHELSGPGADLYQKLDPGIGRFLEPQFSAQFAWFLPLGVAGVGIAILFLFRRNARPAQRCFLVLCAAWFVCSGTVLAMMTGIVHPYYAITTVPSLSCLAAFAATYLVRRLARRSVRLPSGLVLATCLILSYVTVSRSVSEFPWLPPVLLSAGSLAVAIVLLPPVKKQRQAMPVLLIGASILLGPAIWSVNTVLSPHVGAGVVAGPSTLGIRSDNPDRAQLPPGTPASFTAVMFGDLPPQGVLGRIKASPASVRWAAAAVGSETAANYQLESSKPVLAVGGFDGTDPFPTLEQFQTMVHQGSVGSFVIQNLPPLTVEGRGESARIVQWVENNFRPEIVDGATVYSLAH
ncbi:glycosyltransferase family 39 protein [Arthrobacter bambusae]|uniref:glycosyltransferase family 39 protein n=1 Tax=Arthrobacter bambusae TaxID=1338426 RepID=UPI0027800753|nr:glycosyltransferase family 39 protein [Arthrobacter bambusae]MDQ0031015.1 4-amino-4-deoxy-L-arabinose transferase-like glycosyltransferase [Arthrobacter bambusae]MDQ0098852.1 4-amino-4-deoxy-L-arabinose transferase-like glycosyltransferase [Arthrobacter bambusae]